MELYLCQITIKKQMLEIIILTLLIQNVRTQIIGKDCILKSNYRRGNCISIYFCEYAQDLLKSNILPQHSGFENGIPIVCCPASTHQVDKVNEEHTYCAYPKPGECVQRSKCQNYISELTDDKAIELTSDCEFFNETDTNKVCCPFQELYSTILVGTRSKQKCAEYFDVRKIIGAMFNGQEARSGEFPHMAAIGYGEKSNKQWLCGGSLISERFVLTAAHCVSSYLGPPKWTRLGGLDLKEEFPGEKPNDFEILDIKKHPAYSPFSHYHDIALLKIESYLTFPNTYYNPICLHTEENPPGTSFVGLGWGKTDYNADQSSHLLKGDLNLINHEICSKKFQTTSRRKLRYGINKETQICAGHLSGTDACQGDSGGPLQVFISRTAKVKEHYSLVGITSFGKGCGISNSVGVYTRVSAYISWIEDIVWPF